jgi:hypothetical protein
MDEDQYPGEQELVSRAPSIEDLVALCRHLNASESKYLVVGGFAIRGAGYGRETMDLDLIIATDLENEAKVYKALESLPDQAVLQLSPGEVSQYTVVRIGDEICVDLMASACGIAYEEASQDQIIRLIDGVPIPFASPRMLYRMKINTHREKDRADLLFLRENYPEVLIP